jgi:hypothetical protein
VQNDHDKTRAEMLALVARASRGDAEALPLLKQVLAGMPRLVELLGGDLPRRVAETVLSRLSAGDQAVEAAVRQKMETLRADLAGEKPTAVEGLLVERVVLTWLRLHDAELNVAGCQGASASKMRYLESRVEMLNRQYLTAIKSLATVRRLTGPVLIGQVNIGVKQRNSVGANPSGGAAISGSRDEGVTARLLDPTGSVSDQLADPRRPLEDEGI